jgi:hypothetical protein
MPTSGTLLNSDFEGRNYDIDLSRYRSHKLRYRSCNNGIQYRVQALPLRPSRPKMPAEHSAVSNVIKAMRNSPCEKGLVCLCKTYPWVEATRVNSCDGSGPLTCNVILRMRTPSLSSRALHPYSARRRHPYGWRRC